MSVEVKAGSNVPSVEVHGLPCSLRTTESGAALETNAPAYWRPSAENAATFRGRELRGETLTLPGRYGGCVIDEFRRSVNDLGDRRFFVGGKFDKFTYWNWDAAPSADDAVRRALEWIEVADALHDPVGELDGTE